jgi:hypothetical protein
MTDRLDELPEAELLTLLEGCGGAAWARAMAALRPYRETSLEQVVDAAWSALDDVGWLQAFEATATSVPENGDEGTRQAAATALRLYRERFQRAFVTASDCEAADELLMRIRIRLGLDERADWRASLEEQRRITWRRLDRLLRGHR